MKRFLLAMALCVLVAIVAFGQAAKTAPLLSDAQKIDFLTASRDWSLARIQVDQAQAALDLAKRNMDTAAGRLRDLNKKAELAGWKLNLDTLKYEEIKPATAAK